MWNTEKGRDGKRPRRKKAKTEGAKRPGRRTSEKEEMEKWNTEKGQDRKRPRRKKAKTEKGQDGKR